MNRRNFLAATATMAPTAAAAATTAPAKAPSLRDQVLGTWRIKDAETISVKTGVSSPWLGRPRPYTGIIIYMPNGMMVVQIGTARAPGRGVIKMRRRNPGFSSISIVAQSETILHSLQAALTITAIAAAISQFGS